MRHTYWIALSSVLLLAIPAVGQPLRHPDQLLHHLYPAGGRQGQTVTVELGGGDGLAGGTSVLVEGPGGVTVRDVKPLTQGKASTLRATFVIASDAPVGRRLVRVAGGAGGLSNFRSFFVGRLPEVVEKEPNQTLETAQEIELPAVINARIDPAMDIDCFAFRAKAGQRLVAAVLAHGMDSLLRGGRLGGFLDTSLELLDDKGRILASAEDTLGLDPVLEHTVKTDGRYALRVQTLFFKGSTSAVYRLTVGEVPYPTQVFPPGGWRGQKVEVELTGPNVRPGTKQTVTIPDTVSPWLGVPFDHPLCDGRELPFVRGDFPETLQLESNDRKQAVALRVPATVNGRFDTPGEHWYRVSLKQGQGCLFDVTAQRHLRSPVDSLVRVFDANGVLVAENDDGDLYGLNQCAHDFPSSDSWLQFRAPRDGDYYVCVTDQGGGSGPQAVYRLAVSELKPDFHLSLWPDAVPVWGAGSTASFLVHMQHWGGLNAEVELRIEGLPPGWTGSVVNVPFTGYGRFVPPYGFQALMTITAPKDAAPGAVAPFQVVGRAVQDGKTTEHVAQPLTFYGGGPSKRMHLRFSPQARAIVAPPMDVWLETPVTELTVRMGERIEVPVRVHRRPGAKGDISIGIDGPLNGGGANCAWAVPVALKPDQTEVMIPLTVGGKKLPGTYGLVASRGWVADFRAARPGPCTPIIRVTVLPAK